MSWAARIHLHSTHFVQLWAAVWLTAALCISEVLDEWLSTSEWPPPTTLDDRSAQLLSYHWDHVHNGVVDRYYWTVMRERSTRKIDRARFERIWRRAEQYAAACGPNGPTVVLIAPKPGLTGTF